TGASRGIGRSICLSLANPDTQIYFNYFSPGNPEAEEAAAAETEKMVADLGSSAASMSVDVADAKDVEAFFEKIVNETGRVDILVNNAGITKDGLLVRMNENDWNMVLNINLKGAFTCTRLAAKIMMKQRYGRIVNIASVVGVSGNPGQANYSASKAGLIGLTKTAAKELAARNVTVNAVAPGFIETDMTAALSEKARTAMLDQVPMRRGGQPEDVAAAVKFLASDDAAYITGQVIHVNGGMYM
ncbi:MAG: 3-oxoacyl-[acyl-carrier-protein] reductase, partial [Deltaproteobacteria bacterium]|nr:3-oxoacyl-[acyl-carrier-protein] reductase [Deltaproteobacteria bacterium]